MFHQHYIASLNAARDQLKHCQGNDNGKTRSLLIVLKKQLVEGAMRLEKSSDSADWPLAIEMSTEAVGIEINLKFYQNAADSFHRISSLHIKLANRASHIDDIISQFSKAYEAIEKAISYCTRDQNHFISLKQIGFYLEDKLNFAKFENSYSEMQGYKLLSEILGKSGQEENLTIANNKIFKLYMKLIQFYARSGEIDKAFASMEEGMVRFNSDEKILNEYLINVEAYANYNKEKDPPLALSLYDHLIQYNQNNHQIFSYCYAGLASIYFKRYATNVQISREDQEKYFQLATIYFEKALAIPTNAAKSHAHMLVGVLLAHGRFHEETYNITKDYNALAEAFDCYQRAIDEAERSEQTRKLGNAQVQYAESLRYHELEDVNVNVASGIMHSGIKNILKGMLNESVISAKEHNRFVLELDGIHASSCAIEYQFGQYNTLKKEIVSHGKTVVSEDKKAKKMQKCGLFALDTPEANPVTFGGRRQGKYRHR